MQHYRYWLLLALFLPVILGYGLDNQEEIRSLAEKSLLIDSLESQLPAIAQDQKSSTYHKLAQLYYSIDQKRSVKNAYNAIQWKAFDRQNTVFSEIYQLLSHYYSENQQADSTLKYLTLAFDAKSVEFEKHQHKLDSTYNMKKQSLASSDGDWDTFVQLVLWGLLFVIVVLSSLGIRKYLKNNSLRKEKVRREQEFSSINQKVTDFKLQVEKAVNQKTVALREELEKERLREADLRKKLKQVEEAGYLKNAFLGSLSHEIRTPLSGIVGFSSLLQTELAVMGNAELYEYTTNIEESSHQLTGLLDNIIDISSIEANMVEVELQFDHFNNIIQDVNEVYQKKAKDKGLVFKVKIDPELPKLKADSVKLKKILNIVVDNGVKFTQSGFVTITTDYNPDKNLALIQVKDTGSGIDPETLKSLLSSFQYGNQSKTQTYQGKGIGLTLAHRFVSMIGGNISINSQLGKGTAVTIVIPCVGENGQASSMETPIENVSLAADPELGEISLFILEDDRMNRMVLEKMLKKAGKITIAVDGDDALSKIENAFNRGEIFRVMLFDMQLPPPWDGVSVMKTVKERMPVYRSVPFIIQTAFAMSGDRDSYIDAGFDDYISKPINKTELLTMIQKQLHHREA